MKIRIGDIFESKANTLVNTVNCVGVMGKGIAAEFKKRFPSMFEEYEYLCNHHEVKPGKPYLYSNLGTPSVLNFPTKDHWRSPSKLSYIVDGLTWFRDHYEENNITSIAFPPLGCGNGGLSWEIVGPVMYQMLSDLPIEIEIFAPYGTSPDKLTSDYLEKERISEHEIIGMKSVSVNPYWYLILFVIQKLNRDQYTLSVGRVIFQKICFLLTREGIPTGFHFSKGSYGPYSKEIKQAITIFSNKNLMTEKESGRMIEVQVNPQFCLDYRAFTEKEMKIVLRCIDLLSRVKNTGQAEMMTTVLFSFDSLKNQGKNPTEIEILNFVEDWKPRWKETEHEVIIDTIKGLSELNWIQPDYSSGYIVQEENLF